MFIKIWHFFFHTHSYLKASLSGNDFFNTHLGYFFNDFVMIHLSPVGGGMLLPWKGIVVKNQSVRSKTTVRRKRDFPLKAGGGPFIVSNSEICPCFFPYFHFRNWTEKDFFFGGGGAPPYFPFSTLSITYVFGHSPSHI